MGVAAAGCGSEDGSTSGAPAEPPGATAEAGGAIAEAPLATAEAGGENADKSLPQRGADRARDGQDADRVRSGTGGGDGARGLPSGGPVTAEGMAKHCPATFEQSTCEALVEAAGKPRDGSHAVDATGDCTEVLTKADCEAAYAVRDRAAEAPDSILMSGTEFRECLENPTPRCEELLGPILRR